ncbi:MAG: hypothetical protein HQL70_10095 [Magnetococcales bacterium]|nr:hypothetical protein [Magnetococcales bacterium]
MLRFKVLTPLRHNGISYMPGAVVEMTAKQAAALFGAVAINKQSASKTGFADTISRLNPADQSQWRRDGLPRTEALSAVAGRRVSAKERDRLWQQWTKENSP